MIDKNSVKVVGRKVSEPVDPTTVFEAGAVLTVVTSNGARSARTVVSTDSAVNGGIAWNDKSLTRKKAVIDESVVLAGTTAVGLKKANISNVVVTNSTGVTTYTVASDYTVNTTNGTLARVSGGAIGDGDTVLASYIYQLAEVELITEGTNVNGNYDDTASTGQITLLRGFNIVPTNVFDTSESYAIGDALKVNTGGVFNKTTGPAFGKVYAPPTAAYPYLTVEYNA